MKNSKNLNTCKDIENAISVCDSDRRQKVIKGITFNIKNTLISETKNF